VHFKERRIERNGRTKIPETPKKDIKLHPGVPDNNRARQDRVRCRKGESSKSSMFHLLLKRLIRKAFVTIQPTNQPFYHRFHYLPQIDTALRQFILTNLEATINLNI
jgi:hypothetical protein